MKFLRTNVTAQRAKVKRLFKLERIGRYEKALEELNEIWADRSAFPEIGDFETEVAAEILLRCGSLLGFFGHHKQIRASQEHSKDLLGEARRRFAALGKIEKIAECENYLALAYWRLGATDEAKIWLAAAFEKPLPDSSQVRLYSVVCQTLFQIDEGDFEQILSEYEKYEIKFRIHGDAFLNGSLSTNAAVALKNLGRTTEALKMLELAEYYHRKSNHKPYLGTIKNNLAQIYKTEKRFASAHEAIDRSADIFAKLKDYTYYGFALDTKAEIYHAAGDYDKALKTVEKALHILRNSENASFLVGTLMTKVNILLYKFDTPDEASICLLEAAETARTRIDEKRMKRVIRKFEEMREQKRLDLEKTRADDETLELILPPSLADYKSVHGVWLNGSHLENYGLRQGLLAIVADGSVKCGELAAILEKETNQVVCGFYDTYFGIVSIETAAGELQLFDAETVKVLGKIIGVTNAEKNGDGKIVVEELLNI